jgi:hypothetical protein
MTARDTFAAAALTGLLASRNDIDDEAAERAYCIADAMLRERSRAGKNDAQTVPEATKCTEREMKLTNEERAAIMASQGFWALEDSPHAATLRSLLERLK